MEQLDDFLKQVSPSSNDPVVSEKAAYDEIEKRKREAEARHLEIQNESDTQDRDQRKDFAERIFSFAAIYMLGVFFMIFISGTETTNFTLSDNVLITLLGTTTANVIGVFAIVVTYLFSRNKRK